MREIFVKENKIIDKIDIDKLSELKKSIQDSKRNLTNMHNNLNLAKGDLIDYYIYRIKAEEAKYDYLIKEIKNTENA